MSCSFINPGKIITLADLLLTTPNTIAKQCQLSISDVKSVLVSVCTERRRRIRKLDDIKHEGNEMFTTGDTRLDDALEGGIRTGMIWEIVGERYSILRLNLQFTQQLPTLYQCCRQDPTGPSNGADRSNPPNTRWTVRLSMLLGHVLHTSYHTSGSDV